MELDTDTRPLAEVRTTNKVKDCPILTAGHIDPHVFYAWGNACHRFAKHSEKKPTEVVTFVADAMLEPRLVAWYTGDSSRIDGLLLEAYLLELARLVLPKNWASKIRNQILSSTQGSKRFMDWKIELENLNAILTTTSPTHALDRLTMLKPHLQANMDSKLKLAIEHDELLCTGSVFAEWAQEVAERDEKLYSECLRTQRLIDQAQSARNA
ncbi:hypothetical protein BDQ17DRAFT_775043 [Cyathus striatus]|nr:hypothetical protein BDQ17DRAFT_775043 [Cyathus striatus]